MSDSNVLVREKSISMGITKFPPILRSLFSGKKGPSHNNHLNLVGAIEDLDGLCVPQLSFNGDLVSIKEVAIGREEYSRIGVGCKGWEFIMGVHE